MFQKVIILFIVVCSFSCSSAQDLNLGSNLDGKMDAKHKVLIPSGNLINSKTISLLGITYILGIDNSNKLIFVSTSDKKFSLDGYKVGGEISKDYDEIKMGYVVGWGYYIKINSEWYAGFNINSKPTKNSKIEWFFKYKFPEGNKNLFKW